MYTKITSYLHHPRPSQLATSNGLRRNQWGEHLFLLSLSHTKVVFTNFLIIPRFHPTGSQPQPGRCPHTSSSPQGCATATLRRPQHRATGHRKTSPHQLRPTQAQGSSWGLQLQHHCVQPSVVSGKTCKNTQIFHRPSSTLPGNMSAVSGAELGGGGCAELVILGCFLGPISSNAKQPSMAKMRTKFQKQLPKHSVYCIQRKFSGVKSLIYQCLETRKPKKYKDLQGVQAQGIQAGN